MLEAAKFLAAEDFIPRWEKEHHLFQGADWWGIHKWGLWDVWSQVQKVMIQDKHCLCSQEVLTLIGWFQAFWKDLTAQPLASP